MAGVSLSLPQLLQPTVAVTRHARLRSSRFPSCQARDAFLLACPRKPAFSSHRSGRPLSSILKFAKRASEKPASGTVASASGSDGAGSSSTSKKETTLEGLDTSDSPTRLDRTLNELETLLEEEKRRARQLAEELEAARITLKQKEETEKAQPVAAVAKKADDSEFGNLEEGTNVAESVENLFSRIRGLGGKPTDIPKIRQALGSEVFKIADSRRYGNGALFSGQLKIPASEARPLLQAKLDVLDPSSVPPGGLLVWLVKDQRSEESAQDVVLVQPKFESEVRMLSKSRGLGRWPLALGTIGATFFTSTFLDKVVLDENNQLIGLAEHAALLTGSLALIFISSELARRAVARHYGVSLGPPYAIPSGWLGCMGVISRIESLVPSRRALFDMSAASSVAAYTTSIILTVSSLLIDGNAQGGSTPIYVEPSFFEPNLFLSFIQYVIGPYADQFGVLFPNAKPGGIPVNPVAFGGLLGITVTAMNLLPAGRLDGGRIVQAAYGRFVGAGVGFFTLCLLGVVGLLSGSVLIVGWALVIFFVQGPGEEAPPLDEITELDAWRALLAFFLLGGSVFFLLPNAAGSLPNAFLTASYLGG